MKIMVKYFKTQRFLDVNQSKYFSLLRQHQVEKFYDTKYLMCMAEVQISSSGKKQIYIRYKLPVCTYVGGRALVCGIVCGGDLRWVLLFFVFGEGPDGELAGLNALKLWRWRFVG